MTVITISRDTGSGGYQIAKGVAENLHHALVDKLTTDNIHDCSGQAGSKCLPAHWDTTGAGDGFVAGLLSGRLLDGNLSWDAALERALRLGHAAGPLATTRKGASPALPTPAAVEALMERAPARGLQ